MSLYYGSDLSRSEVAALLGEARARTRALVAPLTEEELSIQHSPLMSPIVWDLGHIGHFEEVWLLEKLDGEGGGGEGLRGTFNPFENPRSSRARLALPTRAECFEYQDRVRDAVLDRLAETTLPGESELLSKGFVYRLVAQHEYQHNETILQTLQLKKGRPYPAPRSLTAVRNGGWETRPTPEMVRFPGGSIEVGTDDTSAAYDNERPLHTVELGPFEIDVTPVTNRAYLQFVESGAYREPDLWSRKGREWLADSGAEAPLYWTRLDGAWGERFMDRTAPLDPDRPVSHVCFYEAEAFARWADKRLPTELEWEAACTWEPGGARRRFPWGDDDPTPAHANLDAALFEPAPLGSYPLNVSPLGCYGMIGDLWEWTCSAFGPYPGFRAFPYPEYSEVFFGDEYRVLRGGSWATRTGAIRGTFRNWDYPIRRQIFSGLRCARDG